MKKKTVKVLIIEDSQSQAKKIKQTLLNSKNETFDIELEGDLAGGLNRLAKKEFDVVLLDLNLPDSEGINTLDRVRSEVLAVPIVVLSGAEDSNISVNCLKMGAQDYLGKKYADTRLLTHSVRYAIERHALQMQLQLMNMSRIVELKKEIVSWEKVARSPSTSITSGLAGVKPFREGAPDLFNEQVVKYGKLMELAIDQRIYKVKHNISKSLHAIADKVGFLRGGPRDIIDIHNTIMKKVSEGDAPQKIKLYAEEGRLMVLELVGNLALYYRKHSMGVLMPKKRKKQE